ncbi:hypothetical protein Taro_032333 [Colocasia esculenta]|uniref:Uncharacterized protein n=1 Tax=Colocasia esculenta TaxID=4460 RepID=A0A843VUK5_COLES|nr:hypothetical protein [Colocasia esculenta]
MALEFATVPMLSRVFPWPRLACRCVGVCPKTGFAFRTFWWGTRQVLACSCVPWLADGPLEGLCVPLACWACRGLQASGSAWFLLCLPRLFTRCLALEGLSRLEGLRYAVDLAGEFWRVFPELCLGGSGGGSSQDRPLSLLAEVLPRSALADGGLLS